MALVRLTGVIEDGTPPQLRSSAAPLDPRVTLQITQQTTLTVEVLILTAAGNPVDLADAVVTLTVRKSPQDTYALRKTGVRLPAKGVAQFTFTPGDTLPNRVPFGWYVWILTLKNEDGSIETPIPLSPMLVSATAAYP